MNAAHSIWIYTLAVTLIAAWTDWRTRKIPNWLTVPALALGIGVNALAAGWPGAKASLEGAGLALIILLPFVLKRGLGAGDWKLMAAVGAFLGPLLFLLALLASILVSGLMAIVHLIRNGQLMTTLRNMVVLVRGFFSFGFRSHPRISLDNPKLLKLPFGVAAAIATVICYCATRWGVI
jgi:prepilin peptidase CpaA